MESLTMNRSISRPSRRRFLAASAVGLTILPAARMARTYAANERLQLAVFGSMYNSAPMLSAPHAYGVPIVALCEPEGSKLEKSIERWRETADRLGMTGKPEDQAAAEQYRRMARGEGVKFFDDPRRMFDEMGGEIDALVVSHYDHLHGVTCGPALRAGMPVLSERPLGMNISDARKLRALAAETGLPTTYRSPGTAGGRFRRAMELVEDGAIGQVKEVHVWFDRGGPNRASLPQGSMPVPEGLNWDAWLAALPWREYHPDWMAYANWRETCSGGLGTFGPHTTIFPFLALKLRSLWDRPAGSEPIRVTAECSSLNEISFPEWERVRWDIPARENMPPVTFTWHHGRGFAPEARGLIHRTLREVGIETEQEADALMKKAGSLLVGTTGALLGDDHSVEITALPRAKFESIETARPQRIPPGGNIYVDWVSACRGEKPHILASFDNGGPLSELLMMGNIATLFPEETLAYDPAEGRITNKPEANARLGFDYREGWSL